MDSERWKQVDNLLQSVLDRPPEERSEFLRRACAGDEALEREVRSLLASQQEAGSFLESPAMEVAARAIAVEQNAEEVSTSGFLTGQTFSHYRILEKLGAGGMGVVWKARDTRLDRYVALKLLPAAKTSDSERKRRFVQEARTASALNHPNIVTIYDIDQAHGEDFIAMEFVPGKALDQLIRRKGLRLKETLQYAIQVADALAAAHAAGIVHRDLKPGNIMVNENGCVKVVDFGLAKLSEQGGAGEFPRTATLAEVPRTAEGIILGTVAYMSPEQAEGKKVDARTDIFSFGAVLYEMITGRRAFNGTSVVSILSAILRDEPKPATEIIHGVPGELDKVVTRCLRKDPNRRYQHAGDLKIDLQQIQEELAAGDSGVTQERSDGRIMRRWWWFVAATAIAVLLVVVWWLRGPQAAPPPWKLTRLTTDAGLSNEPALSPDGKLVAYSSDRSLDGERDLYIKQVAGGQPIRLTSDGAGNTSPNFSPDGSKIVFRSDRDGGGIYEMPAFGGEVRFLARDGWNPKFSPDGSQVAYWVGAGGVAAAVPGSGAVWVVSVAGGQPQRVGSNFTAARNPIWSPDGKRLLCVGYTSPRAFESSSIDWWLAPTNGGDAVRTGAYEALVHAGLQPNDPTSVPGSLTPVPNVPRPGCWSATDNTVSFSIANGDAQNLWQIGLSPQTGKLNGVLQRLTTGAGTQVDPSCTSADALTFTDVETRRNIWSLPFDLDRAKAKGALERVTQGPARRETLSLSTNGRYVAFSSDQAGRGNIWVRELATGKETLVAGSSFVQRYPVSNSSGTRIAYSVYEKDKRVVYVSAPGGAPEKLCEGCLRATGWSRDEKAVLVFGGNPYQVNVLDLATHQQAPLLKHPTYHLLYAQFSPDDRWVSFTVRIQPNKVRIAVASVDGPKPVPESAWITISEAEAEDWANWSPDGQTLYFTSRRDGHKCLWAQRVDARSGRPVGDAFAVQHLHGRVTYGNGGWSAAGGRIGLSLVEATGNIWIMSRANAR